MKMRRFKDLTPIVAGLVLAGLALGSGVAMAASATGDALAEQVMLNSGFKVKPANTPAKRAQLRALPDHQFTLVKQNGNTYYLYPDKENKRLYAGDHYAYRAYLNFYKNQKLRAKGVVVWEVEPANKSNNRTIQVWEDWSPFDQWR
jgi:hypothetical protein